MLGCKREGGKAVQVVVAFIKSFILISKLRQQKHQPKASQQEAVKTTACA
jgi:hypothetical protein